MFTVSDCVWTKSLSLEILHKNNYVNLRGTVVEICRPTDHTIPERLLQQVQGKQLDQTMYKVLLYHAPMYV
jgi:hypothetical protein